MLAIKKNCNVTVELMCCQVLLTCICAELRVDCLGEETSFVRRLRNCYSITNKDITNIRGWQRMQNVFIYCFTVTDRIFRCVFTVYSVVWSFNFSLLVLFATVRSLYSSAMKVKVS